MVRYLTVAAGAVSCFLASSLGENAFEELMRAYEGRWVGEFTAHSTATGYTETFPVEQHYWVQDDVLRGVAVMQREDAMTSARSRTYVEDGKLMSEISKEGGDAETFIGTVRDSGVVWLPADLKRAKDYQIKETFTEEEGRRVLKTEGFDTYAFGDDVAHIVYRGTLVRQSEE